MNIETGFGSQERRDRKRAVDLENGDYLPDYGATFKEWVHGGSQQIILLFEEGGQTPPLDRDDDIRVGKKPNS